MPTRQPVTPEQRRAELERPGALAALHAERLAAVVRWRSYRAGSHLHRPEPLVAELNDHPAVRWLADDEPPAARDVRVGYDAGGRLAIAHVGSQPRVEQAELFSRLEDGAGGEVEELVEPSTLDGRTVVSVVHLRRDAGGRVVAADSDRGGAMRFRYDELDRLAELEQRTRDQETGAVEVLFTGRCEYDADGRLAAVRWDDMALWEAGRHAHEPELPAFEELRRHITMPLARPLAGAIDAAADRLDDPRFAVLVPGDPLALPPRVVVAGGAWVERMRAEGDALVEQVLQGVGYGIAGVVEADVFAQLDDATRRLMRQLDQRVEWDRASGADAGAALDAARAAVDELAMLLGPGGAASLPVVLLGAGTADLPAAALATGAEATGLPPSPPLPARSRAATLPLTRDGLRDAARDAGLPAAAAAAFADDARLAIALVPDPGGMSQLGGIPSLPPGTPWPRTADGRPLTPLAAIDCAALPDAAQVPDRALLPPDGALLLFADLFTGEPLEETLGYHGRPEAADGFLAVLHLPAGAAVAPQEPPEELRRRRARDGVGLLPEVPVSARPCASLREPWAAAGLLGLDFDDAGYARLHEEAGEDAGLAQLLGHPRPLHDDPREEGEALLLSLLDGVAPGFEYLDAGALHLLAAAEDLRAGRWERVEAVAESG